MIAALIDAYERVRGGLGYQHTPRSFGAFPTDPYSHSPSHLGAQQPGMTGAVKEEILTRLGETGLRLDAGVIRFTPVLLRRSELLPAPASFTLVDAEGRDRTLDLPAGAMAFTHCQVPVVLRAGDGPFTTTVTHRDGRRVASPSDRIDPALTAAVLRRRGEITLIEVDVPRSLVTRP